VGVVGVVSVVGVVLWVWKPLCPGRPHPASPFPVDFFSLLESLVVALLLRAGAA